MINIWSSFNPIAPLLQASFTTRKPYILLSRDNKAIFLGSDNPTKSTDLWFLNNFS